ncbi:Ig-like domain-containing protein [Thalassotalea aquiviva]|uniref:Ig-like domain-containing protein n=1 Tax=Thalassotalea aquiviva TaxID=3242415 RepID=UPI00352A8A3A
MKYFPIFCLTFLLVACGGGDSNNSTPKDNTPSQDNSSTTQKAGELLVIGENVSITFDTKVYSQIASGGNGGSISYSSSNESVGIVDPETGEVAIVGVGQTQITAYENESSEFFSQEASYTLFVNKGHGILLEVIDELTVQYSSQFIELEYFGGNQGDMTFESSDESIAKVFDGGGFAVIELYNTGEVKLTFTELESENYISQSQTIDLKVEKADGEPIYFSSLELFKTIDDKVFQQAAMGGNGGQKLYTSSDPSIASVDEETGVVTVNNIGTVTISVLEEESNLYFSKGAQYTLTIDKGNGQPLDFGVNEVYVEYSNDLLYQLSDYLDFQNSGNSGTFSFSVPDDAPISLNEDTGEFKTKHISTTRLTIKEQGSDLFHEQSIEIKLRVGYPSNPTIYAGEDVIKEYEDPVFTQKAVSSLGFFINYQSSNRDVASVDPYEGQVRIWGVGETIITASERINGTWVRDSYKLVVNKSTKRPLIYEEEIIIPYNPFYSSSGEWIQSYTLRPIEGSLYHGSLQSSNPNVARINGSGAGYGGIRILGIGETTITITQPELDLYAAKTLTTKLIVVPGDSESFSYVKTNMEADLAVKRIKNPLTGLTGGKLTYSSSDVSVATVDEDGTVHIISSGEVEITAHQAETDNFLAQETSFYLKVIDPFIKVVKVVTNGDSFAALRDDGSIYTWGQSLSGGYLPPEVKLKLNGEIPVTDIEKIVWRSDFGANTIKYGGYAALRADGSIVSWGSDVVNSSFAVVQNKLDGTNKVSKIVTNDCAFVALLENKSVVTWGYPECGGNNSDVSEQLNYGSEVIEIYKTAQAFAALKADGSVYTWGNENYGGNSEIVSNYLNGDDQVTAIYASESQFIAKLSNDFIFGWGGEALHEDNFIKFDKTVELLKGKNIHRVFEFKTLSFNDTNSGLIFETDQGILVPFGVLRSRGDLSQDKLLNKGNIVSIKQFGRLGPLYALTEDSKLIQWGVVEEKHYSFIRNDNASNFHSIGFDEYLIETKNQEYLFTNQTVWDKDVTEEITSFGAINKVFKLESALLFESIEGNLQYFNIPKEQLKPDSNYQFMLDEWENMTKRCDSSNKLAQIISSKLATTMICEDGSAYSFGYQTHGGDTSYVDAYINKN